MSSAARRRGHYRSLVFQALVAWGVGAGVRDQFPYVLVVCVNVGRPVAVDFPLLVIGLIDTLRGDTPGGEEVLSLVGQREQSALWAHVVSAVALAFGWWVSGREGPLRNDTVNERTAPCRMVRARRTERESEADIGLAKVVHDAPAWSCYPERLDGFRREHDRPCGFRGKPCRSWAWSGRQGWSRVSLCSCCRSHPGDWCPRLCFWKQHPVLSRCCHHLVGERYYFGSGALVTGLSLRGVRTGEHGD